MLNEKIDRLREVINGMMISEKAATNELLKLSQELDKIIVQSQKINQYGKLLFGDKLKKEFEITVGKLQLFERVYQAIRVVEPISKKILEFKENESPVINGPCHIFLKQNGVCTNCISIRAYNEGCPVFRIDHNNKDIFMVAAVPVIIQNKKFIVELLKNITNSIDLDSIEYNEKAVFKLVEYLNQEAVGDDLTGLITICR